MIAPSGTRLTYVAEFDVSFWDTITYGSQNEGDILTAVTQRLAQQGFVVENSAVNEPWVYGTGSVTLAILTSNSFGGATDGLDDIRRVIDHQFYLTSSLPTASRITNYTLPGDIPQTTGAPPAPTQDPNGSCWSNPNKSALDCIGAGNVGGGVKTLGIILALGLVGIFAAKELL